MANEQRTENREQRTENRESLEFLSQIARKYFFDFFGTFHFYNNNATPDKNCTDMAKAIQSELQQKGFTAHLCVMFSGGKLNQINPNHVVVVAYVDGDKYLFDPSLFLDICVKLPSKVGNSYTYSIPQIEGIQSARYKYENIGDHKYIRTKEVIVNEERVSKKSDIFTDMPASQEQIRQIIGIQHKVRDDMKLGKVILHSTLAVNQLIYYKLKFDQLSKKLILSVGDEKTYFSITEINKNIQYLQGFFPQVSIVNLRHSLSLFCSDMKNTENELELKEKETYINGVHTKIVSHTKEPIYSLYIHGLFSSINSSKAKKIAENSLEQGIGNIRFSFSGNDKSANCCFQDMDLESMSQDIINIFNYMNNNNLEIEFIPVASSLGASSLLFAIQKKPEILSSISAIVLLAPSLSFAENRRRIWKLNNELKTQDKRKNQGYIKEHGSHAGGDMKLGYSLFEQSDQVNLIKYLEDLCIPITIFAARDDDLIAYDDLNRIATKNKNITMISVHDGHQLIHANPLICTIINSYI